MSEDTYEEVMHVLEEIDHLEEETQEEKPNKVKEHEKKQEKNREKQDNKPKNKEKNKKTHEENTEKQSLEQKKDNSGDKTQEKPDQEKARKEPVPEEHGKKSEKEKKEAKMAEKTQEEKNKPEKQEKDPENKKKAKKKKKKGLAPKPPVPGKEEEKPSSGASLKPSSGAKTTSSPAPAGPSPEVLGKVSKLEGEIKMIKESTSEMSEKIEGFAERIGEIRGLVMERETTIREALISIKKMGEVVSELDPMKLIRERRKMKSEITIAQSKIDEYEKIIKDLSKRFSETKEKIDAITDIHTIIELGKDVGKRLQQVEETRVRIDRMTHKIESMYHEINKKFEQLPLLIGKIEKFDALSMEIMKILDEHKVKMEGFLVNEDLDPIREKIDMIMDELQELEQRETKRPISVKETSQLESYKEMVQEELEAIRATNSIIEEQYREAMINENTFNELMGKNRKREAAMKTLLKDINQILEKGLVEETRLNELMAILKKVAQK